MELVFNWLMDKLDTPNVGKHRLFWFCLHMKIYLNKICDGIRRLNYRDMFHKLQIYNECVLLKLATPELCASITRDNIDINTSLNLVEYFHHTIITYGE